MSLRGQRVAILDGCRAQDLAESILRRGGQPCCVRAVEDERRVSLRDVAHALDELAAQTDALAIFATGRGVKALFDAAGALKRKAELRQSLGRAMTVCRGPKPAAALRKEGVPTALCAQAPYGTAELLEALETAPLDGRIALVLHHGERNGELVEALERRGARVRELTLYAWKLPADMEPLRRLVKEIAAGQVGAVAFTSHVQARHLLEVAAAMNQQELLLAAFRSHTVAVAVGSGSSCTSLLGRHGVVPRVVPGHPKIGALVARLEQLLAPDYRAHTMPELSAGTRALG